jgi:hypothetical protein
MSCSNPEKIERRRGPALRLEDRSQQERPEAHADAGSVGQRADPQGCWIRVGRAEIEPEIEQGHADMLPG